MRKIVIICSYLKKIYELRSEALLTQIFVKLSTAIFCLQWFIFGGINGGSCLLPPKIARAVKVEGVVAPPRKLFPNWTNVSLRTTRDWRIKFKRANEKHSSDQVLHFAKSMGSCWKTFFFIWHKSLLGISLLHNYYSLVPKESTVFWVRSLYRVHCCTTSSW